ncbi:hypothetical protein GCM10009116_22590 [Brevundimonas basaltis]|uniref:Uncharacterized protein n=1 Tax=Brevundimonas basaltis TaxID=472166 RepID=A0A7W8HY15_9CAUL|nr:hypothetical protein [Brevundimonas basaltis]MBB5292009.1 hypothetical protein [Brevundimonas basaltis]
MASYTFEATAAARDAAYFASWSAAAAWVIGLASLALTGGGLVFIWRQLKSTEQAAKAAVASAQAASAAADAAAITSRPWLTLSIERVFFGLSDPSDPTAVSCQVDYIIKNIGQTPAMQCGIAYDVFIATGPDQADEIKARLLSTGPHHPRALFPGDSIRQGISQIKHLPRTEKYEYFSVIVGVAALYKLHAEGEWKYTMQFGSLQPFEPRDQVTKHYGIYRSMPRQQAHFLDSAFTPDPT